MRVSSSRSSPARRATHSRPRCTAQGHGELPITLLYGHAEDALRAADVGIVASGTATLEAALARCPHVIFYRVSALTGRIVGRRLLLPYVGLPNVLAGGFVVPEFLQDDATPDNLAQAALNLFDDTVTRRQARGTCSRALRRNCPRTPGALAAVGGPGRTATGGRSMLIAGVDEAGRGPLAGPVYAAAVILDPARPIAGLRDSKLLSAASARAPGRGNSRLFAGLGGGRGRRRRDRCAEHPAGHAGRDAARHRGAWPWRRRRR